MTQSVDMDGYSLRTLQSVLGVSRGVVQRLIEAGFVQPSRGPRNEWRFSYQDVVLLRNAYRLQSARIPARRIRQALSRLKDQLTETESLSCVRLTAVGDTVAVRKGSAQWDANSGQLLLDLDSAALGQVTPLERAPTYQRARRKEALDWYRQAEQSFEKDPAAAEQAYRKAIELAPEPHVDAYINLGVLLSKKDDRLTEALAVFEEALQHHADSELLHYNRAVVLEQMGRFKAAAASYSACFQLNPHNDDALYGCAVVLERLGQLEEAEAAYRRCLELNPEHEHAVLDLTRLSEARGDDQAVIRFLSAWRRSNR